MRGAMPADGRLVGVMHRHEYPGLQTEKLGLFPVALEIWRGFLFVRLEAGAAVGRVK